MHSVIRHTRIQKCLFPATKKVVIDKGNKQLVMMTDGKRQHGSRLFFRFFFLSFLRIEWKHLTPTQTTVTSDRRRPLRDKEMIEQILGKIEYLCLQKNKEGSQNLPDPFHKW